MLQSVMIAPGEIIFKEVERPRPRENEIVIAPKRIGVCGSDIHVFHGKHPYTGYPVVQGHEVSGVVAAVGDGVSGFTLGDPVTFMPQATCGTCYPCRHGMEHICDSLKVMGFQTDGAGQEFFTLPAEKAIKLPANLSLDQGAFIEPLAVAVHALRRGGGVQGKKVLVLGAGPIGNLVAQAALAQGAAAVMISDISEYKLDQARLVGIEHCFNPQTEDLPVALQRTFGPDKADLILECVGAQATINQAVDNARKGSVIVIVGVFGQKPAVDLGLVQDRELSLVGTLMYQKMDYLDAIQLASSGKLHLAELISNRFAFRDYLKAYQTIDMAHGNVMKVMIELD